MTTTILAEKSTFKLVLMPIEELRPHEQGSPIYFELLKEAILRDQVLKYPIIADENSRVILDGMHRWLVLRSLGYTLIPVLLVNAFQNPKIRVGRRRIHRYVSNSEEEIPIREVIQVGLSGRLMKPRSTRHFFPFSKFQLVNCPLDHLIRRNPRDVSAFMAKMSNEECEFAIKEWSNEIEEELEFLVKRKKEVEDEKTEFLRALRTNGNTSKFCQL